MSLNTKVSESPPYKNVFIIDDDPIHVFTTKRCLNSANFCENIHVYKNGKEAFEAVSEIIKMNAVFPEIILLDINMPIWDGWDFLNELEKLQFNKNINIYITSSSKDPLDQAKAKSYDLVKNFISKPFNIDELTTIQ